jgi:predicted kinase
MNTQMLIAITGLPGSGKTTFALSLAQRLQLPHFNSDLIRNELGMRGRYDSISKDTVYTALIKQVSAALQKGDSVLVDATFYKKALREPIIDLGIKHNVPVLWIELRAADHIIKERMGHERPYSEADYSVYLRLKKEYEPLGPGHLTLRSDQLTISEMLDKTESYLS